MSRVKQFIAEHSDLPIQDIQDLLHSRKKVEKTNFDFLFQFLLFYFLKLNNYFKFLKYPFF